MKKNSIWNKSQVPLANYTALGFCLLFVGAILNPSNSSPLYTVFVITFFVTPILGSLVVWRHSKGDTFTDKLMSVLNKGSKTVFFSTFILLIFLTFSGSNLEFIDNYFTYILYIISLFVAFYWNLNPSPNERRTVVDAIALTLGQLVISFILIFVILRIIKGLVNSLK
jgi:hypothetical protein